MKSRTLQSAGGLWVNAAFGGVQSGTDIRSNFTLTEIIGCLDRVWDDPNTKAKSRYPDVYAQYLATVAIWKRTVNSDMHSKHNTANDAARVFRVILDEHRTGLARLLTTVFKDCCRKCGLPSFVEIESLPEIEAFRLSQEIGLACGFWLARKATAQQICDDFEGQFEMRRLSSDAYFLILKNTLVSDDLFYENAGDIDPVLSRDKERICSLCGKPYILLHKGFIKFKGGNRIKPKTIYETSLKFGQAFLKYPYYFCDEEAADALRKISRSFRFVESTVKFSVDAV